MGSTSSNQSGLLTDETALTPAYTPETLVNRETLTARIEAAVDPLTRNQPPEHLFITGSPGVGKSCTVAGVLADYEADTRVSTATINCWQYNTRAALLTELLIQLGYPAPRKGKPVDALLGIIREWLTKHHGVVVALDEVDQLTDVAEVVYDLHETAAAAQTPLPVSLLCLSTESPATLAVDRRSLSRVPLSVVEVPPYSAAELKAIIDQRVTQAFTRPVETVPETVREAVAERVARQTGDCRHALALLRHAAHAAAQADANAVAVAHLPDKQLERDTDAVPPVFRDATGTAD